MEYAIKIDGKYFKEYIYHQGTSGRSFGGTRLQDGDIIGIVLTDKAERTEVRRSIGNTITTLYQIDKMRGKKIEIVPLGVE